MKTAIIIHGMPEKANYFNPDRPSSSSNKHWLPWIQNQLILNGWLAQTPEMPEPYEPVYEKWCSVFEQFKVNKETVLIGHSCGGGFLVRWLSENKIKVGKVVLVAPWLDPLHERALGMFDFKIDSSLPGRTAGLYVMYSTDDDEEMLQTAKILRESLDKENVYFQEFTDKGHFCLEELGTEKFPELLANIKNS